MTLWASLREMKKCFLILVFVIWSASSCRVSRSPTETPKPDGKKTYEEFAATIKTYPYEAPPPRKDRILKNAAKLEIGMTKEQIAELVGEPDYSDIYGPKELTKKWLGSF